MRKREEGEGQGWFWATLALSSITIIAVVLGLWELLENHFFSRANYVTMHYLYVTRGVVMALLLGFWASWYVLRERHAAEEDLRRSREHYRNLLDASPGAVVLFDRDLCVLEWNFTARRTYGFAPEEAMGRRIPTLPDGKEPELEEFLQRVERGDPVRDVETVRRAKSGECFEVQLSLLPFRESPGPMHFMEITENIRERVQMRRKLLEIEKLTSMGKMAAGTAHYLNTPLAAMLLRVQMMRDRAAGDGFGTDLERLESGIHFCKHFVQRLLDFSRPQAAERQPQEICRVAQSVASFLAPATGARGAQIHFDVEGAENLRVLADRNLLEALFSILLGNALDAVPEGRGRIEVRCRAVPPSAVEIRIADNGSGIEDAAMPHIFDPFFSTKPPGRGTGLGLAIARNIVTEHGGAIRLESKRGEGASAIVELPLWQAVEGGAR